MKVIHYSIKIAYCCYLNILFYKNIPVINSIILYNWVRINHIIILEKYFVIMKYTYINMKVFIYSSFHCKFAVYRKFSWNFFTKWAPLIIVKHHSKIVNIIQNTLDAAFMEIHCFFHNFVSHFLFRFCVNRVKL